MENLKKSCEKAEKNNVQIYNAGETHRCPFVQGTADLYANLIDEEFTEWLQADNVKEQVDACLDLIWVLTGYMLSIGVDVIGAWDEVAASNRSKIMPDGKCLKDENGKIIKPEGYFKPNLKQFIPDNIK